jgi:hypothetical protein
VVLEWCPDVRAVRESKSADTFRLTAEQEASFQKACQRFDVSGSHTLTQTELTQLLNSLDVKDSEQLSQDITERSGKTAAPQTRSSNSLPPGWVEAKTDEGDVYYYNNNTNVSQWERPHMQAAAEPAQQQRALTYNQVIFVFLCILSALPT